MRELVQYLNTLHRLNGSNVNTTAEAGINNKYASLILDRDEKIIDAIISDLQNAGKVLLTGFAGDGKTTLAQLVADKIAGKNINFIDDVIRFEADGKKYVIIKDLSEIAQKEATELLYSELMASDSSLLLVSNTGSVRTNLLNIYESGYWHDTLESKAFLETKILKGIECDSEDCRGKIKIGNLVISTFNLVKRDNLDSAQRVLCKILSLPDWEQVDSEENGVVSLNVKLLKMNDFLAVKRMFFIYRKMYEYGIRLTMRNLVEHFAYTITGNRTSFDRSFLSFLFFDNFFGTFDPAASEIEAIKQLKRFSFGGNISSSWKRRIWNGIDANQYIVSLPNDIKDFERFNPLFSPNCFLNCYYSLQDQRSIINMLFFLNAIEDAKFFSYLTSFIDSPSFGIFMEIQQQKGQATKRTLIRLERTLKRVLRDYCSGLRMPIDDTAAGNIIYIAMARKAKDINQATQIVLGEFYWDKNHIAVETRCDGRGIYQYYLKLKNSGEAFDSRMILDLPLLDYIFSIDAGSPLEDIDSVFQKRLENIKLELLRASNTVDEDTIRIVYKDINNLVHPISYIIDKDQIELEE